MRSGGAVGAGPPLTGWAVARPRGTGVESAVVHPRPLRRLGWGAGGSVADRDIVSRTRFSARILRRGGWRRRLIVAALIALVGAAIGAWYATRPARLARIGSDLLHQLTGAEASIEAAQITPSGYIDLSGVSLRVPGVEGPAGRLFDAAMVRIDMDVSAMLRRELQADAVVVLQPTLHVTELTEQDRYNYQLLPTRSTEDTGVPMLPNVYLRHASLRIGRYGAGEYTERGTVRFDGQLTQQALNPDTYRYRLQQHTSGTMPEPQISGTLDVAKHRYTAQLDQFRFTPEQRHLLPRRLRQFWDRLDPAGSLPQVTVKYDADGGLHAQMLVEDVALNLPVPEIEARLHDVEGRFVLDDQTIHIDRLEGRLGNARYTVDGVVKGIERGAPFEVTMRTDAFTLPERPRFLAMLPPPLREHYHRFEPSGTYQFALSLHRGQRGGELRYSGVVDILDGKARYHKFPYMMQGARGRIRFTDRQAVVEHLVAHRPDGGTLRIKHGTVTPPGEGAAVQMTLEATDIPLDDALVRAMEPKHRQVMRTFFDERAYRRLQDQGIIRAGESTFTTAPTTAEDKPANTNGSSSSSPPPTFALGGTVDAEVRIDRPRGHGVETDVSITLRGAGTRLLFEPWPYPLRIVDGSVKIGPDQIMVNEVRIAGITGAKGVVDGRLIKQPGAGLKPELTVRDVTLPVDPLLIAAVPAPQDRWLQKLNATGVLRADGRVFEADNGDIDFAFDIDPKNVQAAPFGGGFALRDLGGEIRLHRGTVRLNEVTARHGDASLKADGQINWAGDERALDLSFTGAGLPVSASLLDLLPPSHSARQRLAQLIRAYNPKGRFDAELTCTSATRESPAGSTTDDGGSDDWLDLDYRMTVRPRALAFELPAGRVALQAMTGKAQIRPDHVELQDVSGRFETGSLRVSGLVALDGPGGAALQIDGQADRVDATTRALLPNTVRRTLAGLALEGGYALKGAELLWRPNAKNGAPLSFNGRVMLPGVSMRIGMPITDLHGRLDIRYARTRDGEMPDIELQLRADRLRAMDRLIEPLSLDLTSDKDAAALRIRALEGRMYDGTLTGDGTLQAKPDGSYRLELAMQDVRLRPLLEPSNESEITRAGTASNGGAGNTERTGRLDAGLTLEGAYNDAARRRGRGAVEVRHAALFDRPLAMALLQTANLTLPAADTFDRASIRYVVDGQTIHLEDIRFEAPTFAITGAGTMQYPTRALNLTLFARNPGDKLGPISEMVNVLKDQLVCIKVGGTLTDPKTEVVSLEGLRQSLDRVFDGSRSKSGD